MALTNPRQRSQPDRMLPPSISALAPLARVSQTPEPRKPRDGKETGSGPAMGDRLREVPLRDLLKDPQTLLRDLVSGGISAVVAVSYALSFAAMIFAGPLREHLTEGVRMALMSAGLTIILVSLTSPFFFSIAGPDSRSAAVQSALAMLLTERLTDTDPAPHILFALALSTAMAGVALYILGKLKMGRWVRYIPYPVVGGFLVSTGWVLTWGGLRVMVPPDVTLSLSMWPQLVERNGQWLLAYGLLFAFVMSVVLKRAKSYFALPTLLVVGTLVTHVLVLYRDLSIEQAQKAGWLLSVTGEAGVTMPPVPLSTAALEFPTVFSFMNEVVVLIAVTAIAVLLTAAAIEVATKMDADLDQELKGHGVANMISGMCGGIVGSNAIARSMLNLQAGAASRLSGVVAGSLCLLMLFTTPKLAGYLSRPVMGATLLYLGGRLLNEWVIKAYSKLKLLDYLLVTLMLVLVIATNKFVIGLFVGALASCLIFAVEYSRVSVIKSEFTCAEYGSKVQRSAKENQFLRTRGRQYLVVRLRGYLFFGSIVGLVSDLRQRIKRSYTESNAPLKAVVLDFRYVNGMDSSTPLSLVKLRQTIEDRNMRLVFTALHPDMERALRREHCIRDDEVVRTFEDLDDALEWTEQRELDGEPSLSRGDLPFVQRLAEEFGSLDLAIRFMEYVERIQLKEGEYLFHQDDDWGATYVVESGRMNIVLERPAEQPLLLRSVTGNTTLGEMGLYRRSKRTASVMAAAPSVVHKLTREAIDRMELEAPKVAAAFHTYVIRTLADRLQLADKALSALERRER
jgi:SulP family sulfate permease